MERKEIEEAEVKKEFRRRERPWRGAGETRVKQVFTSYDRTGYQNCQYIK